MNSKGKIKFGLVKGSGFSPWEAPLHEATLEYGFEAVGICSKDNQFDFSGVNMPIRRLRSLGGIINIPIISKAIQWIKPYRDYMLGFNKAVKDLKFLHTTETFNVFSKQCVDSGKPTIISFCDVIPFNRREKLDEIDRYVKKRAKHFIVTTEFGKRCLIVEGVEESRISVIPHAIDTKHFKPMKKDKEFMRKFKIKDNEKIILMIGELEETKGIQYLIFAFNELLKEDENLKLVIIGRGSLKEWLVKLVEKMKIRDKVIFGGYFPYTLMPRIHSIADVFCLPSSVVPRSFFKQAWNEKFGYVLIEAMACGKPIVTTTAGGIPYVVKDTAKLVAPTDWLGLRREIKNVVYNKKLAEKMGKEGRERAEREYDLKVVAKKLAEVYKRVIRE